MVFGGGTPTGSFCGSTVQTASSGTLVLNNSGDTVVLKGSNGATVTSYTYSSEGGDNQSITRSPDITGSFVKHSTVTDANGALFSPGTKLNGSPFIGVTIEESFRAFLFRFHEQESWFSKSWIIKHEELSNCILKVKVREKD